MSWLKTVALVEGIQTTEGGMYLKELYLEKNILSLACLTHSLLPFFFLFYGELRIELYSNT